MITPTDIKCIQREKNLQQEISEVFIQLWQEEPNDNLAQLAITVFGFNPLKNNSAAIFQDDAFYAVQQPPKSLSVDWEKLELDFDISLANEVAHNYYFFFINTLNINPLMPHLLQKQVITCRHQQELSALMLERVDQNADFFRHNIN